jgi:hypothetical protein
VIHPNFPAQLQALVDEAHAAESKRIAGGLAADWPDYKHRTGILRGLAMLKDFITELTEDKEKP